MNFFAFLAVKAITLEGIGMEACQVHIGQLGHQQTEQILHSVFLNCYPRCRE